MDFGHGGAMVEPSRGFFVHFTRTTEVTSLDKNRAGQEVARRSLQREESTRDCLIACRSLKRQWLGHRGGNLDSAALARKL